MKQTKKFKLNNIAASLLTTTAATAAITAGSLGAVEQAQAAININSNTQYATPINEDKFKNIVDRQALDEKRHATVYDILEYIADENHSDAQRRQYIRDNLNRSDAMRTGETFSLYNTKGSLLTATVDTEPVVRIGSGSSVKGVDDVPNISLAGNTYNFAGGVTSGMVSIGDEQSQKFRTVTNMAAGRISATSTDAINGSQLHATNQALGAVNNKVNINTANINKGINFVDGNNNKANVKLGGNFGIEGDSNISTKISGSKVVVGLKPNVTAQSVTTGPVSISGNGVNAGNKKITNVADGNIADGSKDAINGGQLKAELAKIKDTNTVTEVLKGKNIDVTKVTGTVTNGKSKDTYTVKLADDLTQLNSASFNSGVVINNAGINAGNKKITNVSKGAVSSTSKDGINGSQLHGTADSIKNIFGGNAAVTPEGKVTFTDIGGTGKGTIHEALKASKSVVKAGDNITVASKVEADGSTTYTVSAKNASKETTVLNNDGKLKVTEAVAGNQKTYTVDLSDGAKADIAKGVNAHNTVTNKGLTFVADSGDTGVKKLGESVGIKGSENIVTEASAEGVVVKLKPELNNIETINIKEGATINGEGINMNGDKITGLADGEIAKGSKDAINGGQLFDALSKVKDTDTVSNVAEGKNIKVTKTAGQPDQNGKTVDTYTVEVADELEGLTSATFNGGVVINDGGINAGNKVIEGVADGALTPDSKQAVNGSQLHATNQVVEGVKAKVEEGINFVDGEGNKTNVQLGGDFGLEGDSNITTKVEEGKVVVGLAEDVSANSFTAGDVVINKDTGINAGNKVIEGVAKGEISATSTQAVNGAQLYEVIKLKTEHFVLEADQGKQITVKDRTTVGIKGGNNIVTETVGNDVNVSLADEIAVDGLTINNTDISITEAGINAGGTVISNVAEGVKGTDAVNVNQLNRVAQHLDNKIDQVDSDAKAGVAAAMAVGTLGQAWEAGQDTVSVAGSTYGGKVGWAVGGSNMSDNGKWLLKYNVSGSNGGKIGAAGSITFTY